MLAPRRLSFLIMALVVAALLAACGGAPAAVAPTAEPEPTAKPTSTPRPTPKPKPTAEPTEEPTEEPIEEPTEEPVTEPTGDQLVEIEVGDLEIYEHPNGLFSIEVPQTWEIQDNSTADEAIVLWSDPSGNGFVAVDLYEDETARSNDELTEILENFLSRFEDEEDFSMDPAEVEEIGDIRIVWSYTGTASNGVKGKLLGNSFIEQKGNKISLFTIVLPDAQFESLKPALEEILNSYTYDPAVAVNATADDSGIGAPTDASGLLPVQIGDLETFEYDTGLFSIDVPNDWTLSDRSQAGEAILLWLDPTENAFVAVDIFGEPQEQTEGDLTTLLQTYLENTFGEQVDFSMDDPTPQSDGSVLVVWSYTTEASGGVTAKMLGNSFVEQRGDKLSILTTLVPSDQFDALVDRTNEIINSYRVDPAAALP